MTLLLLQKRGPAEHKTLTKRLTHHSTFDLMQAGTQSKSHAHCGSRRFLALISDEATPALTSKKATANTTLDIQDDRTQFNQLIFYMISPRLYTANKKTDIQNDRK